MAVLLRILLLCSLVIHNFVSGRRLTGDTGMNCCKLFLPVPLKRDQYSRLRGYEILPSHGRCPEYLQFTTWGNHTFCIAMSKGQEMRAFLDSQAPSKKEFQKGWNEGTGIWEGTSKTTLPPAVTPRSQDPPTAGMSPPDPQSPLTSTPSVSPSPQASGSPGREGRTMPTSSVTAQTGSHGQELTRVHPGMSSSDQLQEVTTGTQDKATDGADIHLGKGMGTTPGRIIAMATSPSNGQGREEIRSGGVTHSDAPSKEEFQKGWNEGTGIWEGTSKTTLPPAVTPRSQDPPTAGMSPPDPQSPLTSTPSVSPSPQASGSPGREGRTMPTSSVTAQTGSHGQELTRVHPGMSSSDQLQEVTTGTQDKATDGADIHLGKGMGTTPGRIITMATSPSNGQGREEIRSGGVTHSDGTTLPGAGAGDSHFRISEDRNRPSQEGPAGQRSHIGLMLVCLFSVAAVALLMWALLVRGSGGKVYRVGDYYCLHPSKESATLVHYSRDFDASCGVV
ncbi:mucin-1-like [Hemiscyllium ocellatum]|uniref:mucin-1-like n=1 Tax=Hemiscyllium ocellatum TaxID=170820 RepID=UPI0029668F0A|nr:mucin-1-like [Hemiscyllium ocellatum]